MPDDSMTFAELVALVNEVYPDDLLDQYFHGGEVGDGLARFIVQELSETFDANESREEQLAMAGRAMKNALEEMRAVWEIIDRRLNDKGLE